MKTRILLGFLCAVICSSYAADTPLTFEGGSGPGRGKHIVFLAGDEEYRSEEALPMMAKILSARHGFRCTVLFSLNPADGTIDPMSVTNLPGMEILGAADLCFMKLRFRDLPDDQMVHLVNYVNSGKPLIGLRTSTHAFAFKKPAGSKFGKYDWRSKEWPGGFGQQVLGETWINHHGDHNKQSTRGIVNTNVANHPILKGVQDIWGPSDVYGVIHLPADAKVLVWGQVLTGMKPEDPPLAGTKNDPMMPLVWLRTYEGETGKSSRILTSTIGAAVDLQSEDLRRLLVNACYDLTGLSVPPRADVAYVGEYRPLYFGFGKHTKGVRPADLRK